MAYVNPVPCKTRGCPRFAEGPNGEFCESCLNRGRRTSAPNIAVASSSASSMSYGGVSDRRDVSPVAKMQPRNCISAFCEFFASGEFGPYCSKCFIEQTKKDAIKPPRVGMLCYILTEVVNLSLDKNIPEGKPSPQCNRK